MQAFFAVPGELLVHKTMFAGLGARNLIYLDHSHLGLSLEAQREFPECLRLLGFIPVRTWDKEVVDQPGNLLAKLELRHGCEDTRVAAVHRGHWDRVAPSRNEELLRPVAPHANESPSGPAT